MARAYTVKRGERRKGEKRQRAERERLEKKRLKAAREAGEASHRRDASAPPRVRLGGGGS